MITHIHLRVTTNEKVNLKMLTDGRDLYLEQMFYCTFTILNESNVFRFYNHYCYLKKSFRTPFVFLPTHTGDNFKHAGRIISIVRPNEGWVQTLVVVLVGVITAARVRVAIKV